MTGPITTQAAEIIPSGFSDPKYLAVATGIAFGGLVLERFKSHLETRIEDRTADDEPRLQLADPFRADQVNLGNRRTKIAENVAYYATLITATLATVQFGAKPFDTHDKVYSDASVVVAAGYGADTQDVQGVNGNQMSRFDASIQASLDVSSTSKVPFSLSLDGSTPRTITNTPTINLNSTQTKKAISKIRTPDFENGDSLGTSVLNASPASSTKPNNVIILASNLDPSEVSNIQKAQAQINSSPNKGSISAIVVGNSNGIRQIGIATLGAPVDVVSFQTVLGKNNVYAARSTTEIKQDINQILSHAQANQNKSPNNNIEDLAILFGVAGLGVAVKRRLAGLVKLYKGGKK
jgi:hypothetical protein